MKDARLLAKRIPEWINRKVRDAHAKGVVVGVSGGIDSAVAAVLSKKAVGGKNVLCLLLPCESPLAEKNDARLVCRSIGLPYKEIDLAPVYRQILKILPKGDKKTLGNIKPRLRMIILYYFANLNNYIVAGTGNRSELLLGYFTKYGDGGVDILPIGGLIKSEVRELARELRLPSRIIEKKPTAGLWPGQTDEEEMGMTYGYIDSILRNYNGGKIRGNKKIENMAEKAAHKLSMPEIFK